MPIKKTLPCKPGRKPMPDKKVGISFYMRPSDIKKLGGKDKVRVIAIDAIEGKLTGEESQP